MITDLYNRLTIVLLALLASPGMASGDTHSGQFHTDYVGTQACNACHKEQVQLWQGSHHQLAMQEANEQSVLGNFDNTEFTYNGVTSTFFKKDEKFWVRTDGKNGELQNFPIQYAFGVDPLQQYLIGFEDGRMQALTIAWDSRPQAQGGQRWFHLFPDDAVDSDDVLHWTAFSHNWNARCAECHSTNLKKNYQQTTNSYKTSWSEINVACEACHGPAAAHVQWANSLDTQNSQQVEPGTHKENKGFKLQNRSLTHWQFGEGASTASPGIGSQKPSTENPSVQIGSCMGCHSRRSVIETERFETKQSTQILDQYVPRLIEEGLYFADGQIHDEVYVYGSFIQSKMYNQGVVCSDCHDPHSLKLKAPGNAVCAQCHSPQTFDQPEHHHHKSGNSGADCANCHMPETTYMQIDPRRDHSLRVPRPDLSLKLGTPNACNQCHQDQTPEWAAKHFKNWYPQRANKAHYGEVLHAFTANSAQVQSTEKLLALVDNPAAPAMVRASALLLARNYPGRDALNTAATHLNADDPLLRLAAVRAIEMLPRERRAPLLWPRLSDPVKAVRLETTRLLAGLSGLDAEQTSQLNAAVDEAIASYQLQADAPSAQLNLGVLYTALGNAEKALAAYRHALRIEPQFIPAYINQADVYRALGEENRALNSLRGALRVDSNNANANFSMGLLMVRQKQSDKALQHLSTAAVNAPGNAHYSYVYAVALFENNDREQAVDTLKNILRKNPGHRETRSALHHYLNAMGRSDEARLYAPVAGRGAGHR